LSRLHAVARNRTRHVGMEWRNALSVIAPNELIHFQRARLLCLRYYSRSRAKSASRPPWRLGILERVWAIGEVLDVRSERSH
jgi:hypothetical protein